MKLGLGMIAAVAQRLLPQVDGMENCHGALAQSGHAEGELTNGEDSGGAETQAAADAVGEDGEDAAYGDCEDGDHANGEDEGGGDDADDGDGGGW